jgi:hypothetical protein
MMTRAIAPAAFDRAGARNHPASVDAARDSKEHRLMPRPRRVMSPSVPGPTARRSATARRCGPTAATRRSPSAPTSRTGTGRGPSWRPSGSSSRSSAGRGSRRGSSRPRTVSSRRCRRSAFGLTRASAYSRSVGGDRGSSASTRTRSTTTSGGSAIWTGSLDASASVRSRRRSSTVSETSCRSRPRRSAKPRSAPAPTKDGDR